LLTLGDISYRECVIRGDVTCNKYGKHQLHFCLLSCLDKNKHILYNKQCSLIYRLSFSQYLVDKCILWVTVHMSVYGATKQLCRNKATRIRALNYVVGTVLIISLHWSSKSFPNYEIFWCHPPKPTVQCYGLPVEPLYGLMSTEYGPATVRSVNCHMHSTTLLTD
jgi:hypothetical protein